MAHRKNITVTLLALLACSIQLQAQDAMPRHEVTGAVSFGPVAMPFHGNAEWTAKNGFGISGNAAYTLWFNSHVGIQAGIGIKHLETMTEQSAGPLDFTLSGILPLNNLGIVGFDGNTLANIHATAASCDEKQYYTFLEVPLRAALAWNNFYGNVGVAYAKAVKSWAKYSYNDVRYEITGLPEMEVTPPAPVPVNLTGTTAGKVTDDAMYKPSFLLFDGEIGYRFTTNPEDKMRLTFGLSLYTRCALSRFATETVAEPLAIESTTVTAALPSSTSLVDNIGFYECGIRLNIMLGCGNAD